MPTLTHTQHTHTHTYQETEAYSMVSLSSWTLEGKHPFNYQNRHWRCFASLKLSVELCQSCITLCIGDVWLQYDKIFSHFFESSEYSLISVGVVFTYKK